jgi:hypothetical protein
MASPGPRLACITQVWSICNVSRVENKLKLLICVAVTDITRRRMVVAMGVQSAARNMVPREEDDVHLLDDVWVFSYDTETWQELDLSESSGALVLALTNASEPMLAPALRAKRAVWTQCCCVRADNVRLWWTGRLGKRSCR